VAANHSPASLGPADDARPRLTFRICSARRAGAREPYPAHTLHPRRASGSPKSARRAPFAGAGRRAGRARRPCHPRGPSACHGPSAGVTGPASDGSIRGSPGARKASAATLGRHGVGYSIQPPPVTVGLRLRLDRFESTVRAVPLHQDGQAETMLSDPRIELVAPGHAQVQRRCGVVVPAFPNRAVPHQRRGVAGCGFDPLDRYVRSGWRILLTTGGDSGPNGRWAGRTGCIVPC
jgi:hypothetical protein